VKYVIGRVVEIPPGARKLVTVAGRSIGIFNLGGEFFAVRNRCPHRGASLCLGEIYGTLDSPGPGEYRHSPSDAVLRCPWHGWEFELRTGRSWFDPRRVRVRNYDVTVTTESPQARIEGPFTAETYPVTTAEAYIQIDV
jgi:3-phenylpropionate/trans-cinnamate dioxygenase ferredoxin subunit